MPEVKYRHLQLSLRNIKKKRQIGGHTDKENTAKCYLYNRGGRYEDVYNWASLCAWNFISKVLQEKKKQSPIAMCGLLCRSWFKHTFLQNDTSDIWL